MTSAEIEHHTARRRRFALHGSEGFIRMAMTMPGRHGGALEISHAKTSDQALQLCSLHAAQLLSQLIEVHRSGGGLVASTYYVVEVHA